MSKLLALAAFIGVQCIRVDEEEGCTFGMGKCCTTKCDGTHRWAGIDLQYENCVVVEGAWIVDDNVVKPQMTVLSGVSLPQGDYVCQETCDIVRSGKGRARQAKVYRSGGDNSEPPVCGFNGISWR
ncbi:unnamed protein product [Effrenium voratum]|nr:unnamed protein product [Effrenium voratum]